MYINCNWKGESHLKQKKKKETKVSHNTHNMSLYKHVRLSTHTETPNLGMKSKLKQKQELILKRYMNDNTFFHIIQVQNDPLS